MNLENAKSNICMAIGMIESTKGTATAQAVGLLNGALAALEPDPAKATGEREGDCLTCGMVNRVKCVVDKCQGWIPKPPVAQAGKDEGHTLLENEPESIAEMKRFIHDITHELQSNRSKCAADWDYWFQRAYKLYSKYNVEEPSYPPVRQPNSTAQDVMGVLDIPATLLTIEQSLSKMADIAESLSVTLGDKYGKMADSLIDEMERVQALRNQANGIEMDEFDADPA